MTFHPFNQCWRWDKASGLKTWLRDGWTALSGPPLEAWHDFRHPPTPEALRARNDMPPVSRYRCVGGPLDNQWHAAVGRWLIAWPGGPTYELTAKDDGTLVFVLMTQRTKASV
jgi:hypothetical protein